MVLAYSMSPAMCLRTLADGHEDLLMERRDYISCMRVHANLRAFGAISRRETRIGELAV